MIYKDNLFKEKPPVPEIFENAELKFEKRKMSLAK